MCDDHLSNDPMAQKTRQLTEQFYAQYNQKLAKLLDDAALTCTCMKLAALGRVFLPEGSKSPLLV